MMVKSGLGKYFFLDHFSSSIIILGQKYYFLSHIQFSPGRPKLSLSYIGCYVAPYICLAFQFRVSKKATKFLRKSPKWFDIQLNSTIQIELEISSNFCGILRKPKLQSQNSFWRKFGKSCHFANYCKFNSSFSFIHMHTGNVEFKEGFYDRRTYYFVYCHCDP